MLTEKKYKNQNRSVIIITIMCNFWCQKRKVRFKWGYGKPMPTSEISTTYWIAKIITKVRKVVQWNTWHLENISSILRIKKGFKANMFQTIFSTNVTQVNVQKEDEHLVLLGLIKRENDPYWGVLSFAKHKLQKTEYFF